jgi:hypothetical protein
VVHWYYSLEKVGSLCHGEQVHWHVSTGGGSTLLYLPWRRAGVNLIEKRWYLSSVNWYLSSEGKIVPPVPMYPLEEQRIL